MSAKNVFQGVGVGLFIICLTFVAKSIIDQVAENKPVTRSQQVVNVDAGTVDADVIDSGVIDMGVVTITSSTGANQADR